MCPSCMDSPLHEIADGEYGCDKCKNIYYLHDGDIEYEEVKRPGKDKDGNPLYPEQIL